MKHNILLILFFFSFCISSFSQNLFAPTYGVEEGLAQSQVFSIIQDNKGRIWAGTVGGGISVFNGKTFTNITTDNGLEGNIIHSLYIDSKNNIWIGTDQGLTCYKKEKFHNFKYRNSKEPIWKIIETNNGKILLATSSGMASVKNDSVIPVITNTILDKEQIFTIFQDKKGSLWLGTKTKGVFNIKDEEIQNFNKSDGLCNRSVRVILQDKNGVIWIGTDRGINIYYKDSLKKFKHYASQSYIDGLIDKNGYIWFSTYNGWLSKYDSNNIMQKDSLISVNSFRFKNKRIRSFIQDEEKTFWIGTETGLIKFPETPFLNFNSFDKLHDENVYAIAQINDNQIFVGAMASKHSLTKFNFKNFNHLTSLNKALVIDDLVGNRVFDIIEDNDGNVWIGAWNGISKITPEGNITNYSPKAKKGWVQDTNISSLYINAFYKDSDGIIWAASYNGITQIIDGKFVNFNKQYPDFEGKQFVDIFKDSKGRMWLPTGDTSLYIFDNNKLTDIATKEKFPKFPYRSIIEDYKNNFWIAAGSSVLFYDGNKIDTIDTQDGLMAQQVYLLIIDNRNQLFIGTNKGLNRIDLTKFYNEDTIYIRQYGYMDGFVGKECNRNAVMKDSKGRLWFGTVKGLTVYDPDKDAINMLKPKVFITDISINYQKPDWSQYSLELDSVTNLPVNPELPYTENNILFSFVSNSLKIPEKVSYKYQLIPIDKEWSPAFNKNELDFKSLSPNEYTLKIIAANDDGIWSDEPFVFKFTIKPPFWQTWWFYSVTAAFLVVGIFVYIKLRERKLIHEKRILEGEVKKRTIEIVKQKEIVEQKNKDITDSINYAENIQFAILPNEKAIRQTLPESFVFFRPKDVISGDFYWFAKHKNKIYIIAADCTGHGVPGALMSMLGMAFINELIHGGLLNTAAEYLNELRKNVIEALNQEEQTERKDGMDIAFCIIDSGNNTLNFAGANNPLYIVRNKNLPDIPGAKIYQNEETNLYEIKADKMPIGLHINQNSFTDHFITTEPTDYFYIFSDGYADQFGGPKGKKFKYSTLRNLLAEIHPLKTTEKKKKLEETFLNWLGNMEQIDDVLLIGFKNITS